ncbi:MAG: hypothetical protein RLZZ156_467 [Deinococcota bacterium]
MPKVSPLKSLEIIRKLRALGYEGPFPSGRHVHMVHPDKKFPLIPIPMHPGDIGVGLIRKIIRDVGVSLEQWLDL